MSGAELQPLVPAPAADSGPADMTRVVETVALAGLDELRLLWQALVRQTAGASFFQTLDWLEVYWRHFGEGQRLRVLTVYAAGKPVGILPLVVRREWNRLGAMRVLTFPLHDWGTFYGPIGPNPTATLLAGLGHVARSRRDWDLVDLRWIHPQRDAGRTPTALAAAGLPAVERPLATSAQVELAGTWDAYWATRTSRWRNNVRRNEKRLAAAGRVTHLRYRPLGTAHADDDPRWELFDACLEIAAASWQAQRRDGTTLSHAQIRDFVRDAHLAAARAGALDLNLLLVDETPLAFNYAYHFQGQIDGLRTGFRPGAGEGAGSVLQARMIRDSFARGDRDYNLGADYLRCKRYWQTRHSVSLRYTHFPRGSPRAQLLRARRAVGDWLSAKATSRAEPSLPSHCASE